MVDKVTQQTNAKVNTSQFTGIGFVGIKKVEYFPRDGESVAFDDLMELLESRSYSNGLMLGFFSIKPFGIEKVEKVDSILALNEDSNEMMIKQGLKKAALFDFAEAESSGAGVLHLLIAADCIIHWDNEGSYIQPTQENSILLDLEDIIKEYPKSYDVVIYSEKDLSNFTYKKFEQKSVLDVPVRTNMWYNQPTFQQTYGNAILTAGLVTLALAYGALNWQKSTLEDASSQISDLKSRAVNERFYSDSSTELASLQKSLGYKEIVSLISKDISNSLSKSGFKLDKISFSKNNKTDSMMVTIQSKENVHSQFSVQEPLAQRVLDNSHTIKAIRKKTVNEPVFILEALIDLKEVKEKTRKLTNGGH
ncbi:MAG TPA: hypothetical protein DCL21_02000 [Alphaproteobacteria bacterium]|nr:hypothetical protein [Alphaproteobacteria bacterium]